MGACALWPVTRGLCGGAACGTAVGDPSAVNKCPLAVPAVITKPSPVGTSGGVLWIGAEHGLFVVPNQLAAAMGPQVHDRRPAARHGNAIARNLFQHSAFARLRADVDRCDALAAFDFGDAFAEFDTDAQRAGLVNQLAFASAARVDDRGNIQPRFLSAIAVR